MRFRTQLISVYAVILVFVLFLTGLTYVQVLNLLETNRWVTHTLEANMKAALLTKSMVDRETGQRGFMITGIDTFLEPYIEGKSVFESTLEDLKVQVSDNPPQVRRLEQVGDAAREWENSIAIPLIEMRRQVGNAAFSPNEVTYQDVIDVVSEARGKAIMDSIRRMLADFVQVEEGLLATRQTAAERAARQSIAVVAIGAALVVLIGVPAILTFARRTLQQVGGEPREIARLANQGAEGDLRQETWSQGTSTTGILAAMQSMIEALRKQVLGIREGVDVVATSSGEISTTVTQLAASASEAAAAISQTTSTLEELKQGATMASKTATGVADMARRNADVSKSGQEAVDATVRSIEAVRVQVATLADSVVRLSEQGQSVSVIIGMVDDLAEQSNLLAVNAAIEAAKAGDVGSGFAVVAQEIRSLADQSKQATSQVRGMLNQIQRDAGSAVMATEEARKAVDSTVGESERSGKAIEQLASSTRDTAMAAEQIAASSRQQLAGVEQVTLAMENIRESGNQNVAGTRELESAAQTLSEMGQSLKRLVDEYRL